MRQSVTAWLAINKCFEARANLGRKREVRIFVGKVVTMCSGQREEESRQGEKGERCQQLGRLHEEHSLDEAAANAVVLGKDGILVTSGQPAALALGEGRGRGAAPQEKRGESRGVLLSGANRTATSRC